MGDLIKEGADALQAGNRGDARKLLLTAVKQNPDNERAWRWLYNATDNDKERIYCLNQILRINPSNGKASQLLNSLTSPQIRFENQQTQASQKMRRQVQIPVQPVKKPPLNNSIHNKNRQTPLVLIGIIGLITLCIFGFCIVGLLSLLSSGEQTKARVLSAEDVFEVSAVDVIESEGYTVTSAVCEVVSSERFEPLVSSGRGKIVFHAFRIAGSRLKSETVVLFYSNHTAAQGSGWVHPVNTEAINLQIGIDPGSSLSYPITVDTAGANVAIECARQAGGPVPLKFKNFDVNAWRDKAIKRFGPEQTYSDGSKDDHVRTAISICRQSDDERTIMLANLGKNYEGSFQKFVIETFCPYYIGNN